MTRRCRIALPLVALLALASRPAAWGQDEPEELAEGAAGARWAIVIIGLPGDEEHEAPFRALGEDYVNWFTRTLSFDAERVLLVGHDRASGQTKLGARKDELAAAAARVAAEIQPQDALWYVAVGHANHDGEHGWLHLAGPDINQAELAELFAGIECREQVFWMTHTCSGWFLPALSQPGRIVVAATEPDQEVNETEFPRALLDAAGGATSALDRDDDGQVSLAELFAAASAQVAATFAADRRVPTEHAQLDDDGDGRGTEAGDLLLTPSAVDGPKRDGLLAAGTVLPLREKILPADVEGAESGPN